MGNEQSIITAGIVGGATSTTNWKRYQIQRVERRPNSIKFFLDGDVKYSNGYYDYVNCDNTYPYYNIHAGDRIETNWYRTEDYSSWHEFTGSDNLRAVRFQQRLCDYACSVPNRGGRELFRISGTFVVERKTERYGNVEVEYIEKVTYVEGEFICNTESLTFRAV